jgi:hypothetical protein
MTNELDTPIREIPDADLTAAQTASFDRPRVVFRREAVPIMPRADPGRMAGQLRDGLGMRSIEDQVCGAGQDKRADV